MDEEVIYRWKNGHIIPIKVNKDKTTNQYMNDKLRENKEYKTLNGNDIEEYQKESDEIFDTLDNNEIQNIYNITSSEGYFIDINGNLEDFKGDINKLSYNDREIVKSLDKTLDKMSTKENIKAYKVDNYDYYKDYKKGDIITINKFMNTTIDKQSLESFEKVLKIKGEKPIYMNINVPKQTKALYVGLNGNTIKNEYELLINRGYKYKVLDFKDDVIDIEIVKGGNK